MEARVDFKRFFGVTVEPILLQINQLRRRMRMKNFYSFVVYVAILDLLVLAGFLVNCMVYGSCFEDNSANIPLIIVLILFIVSLFYFYDQIKGNKKVFEGCYKSNIIETIVKHIDNSLVYDANNKLAMRKFNASRLFHRHPDCYSGENYVRGVIGRTEFAFSEIHAKYKTETIGDDGSSYEEWKSLFDGLLFKADFNRDFNGEYFLFSQTMRKMLRKAGRLFTNTKQRFREKINTEDIAFREEFVMYGTNQEEGRFVLSSDLMKQLVNFKRETGKKIKISLVKSSLYIAIPCKKTILKPNYNPSADDEKRINEYYRDLEMAVEIVKDLNLNTRIW